MKKENPNNLYVLEEQFYPETWKNDMRMGVLLAEFRPKTCKSEKLPKKLSKISIIFNFSKSRELRFKNEILEGYDTKIL
jgi:hypothetical protein